MSVLKTLKLSAAQPIRNVSPTERGREKLRRYLNEQKALLAARIEGKPFTALRTVSRKDEAGNKVRSEIPRIVREGWFVGEDGKAFFQLRYGARPLELAKGMNAVEVGKLQALPDVIDTLFKAIEAGEFDGVLTAAVQARRVVLKRATA